jgi:hypothetical protein
VLQTRVAVNDLEKITEAHLLQDSERFYLTLHRPPDPAVNPWGGPWPNVINGIRCIPVNGTVHAFERASGKLKWKVETANQMLLVEQFQDLPILLFTARSQRAANAAGGINRGGGIMQVAATKSFDKRTGKLLYDKEQNNQANQFYALNVNVRTGTIELVGYNIKIIHAPETDVLGDGAKTGGPGASMPKTPAHNELRPAPVQAQPVIK